MLTLELMSGAEFQDYLNEAIGNYAKEHVIAGNWNESEAVDKATKEYAKLLPEGQRTEDNYLYTILVKTKPLGGVAFSRSKDKGFIYDINIWENYQGLGYGKEAMKAIEGVGKLGIEKINSTYLVITRSLEDYMKNWGIKHGLATEKQI